MDPSDQDKEEVDEDKDWADAEVLQDDDDDEDDDADDEDEKNGGTSGQIDAPEDGKKAKVRRVHRTKERRIGRKRSTDSDDEGGPLKRSNSVDSKEEEEWYHPAYGSLAKDKGSSTSYPTKYVTTSRNVPARTYSAESDDFVHNLWKDSDSEDERMMLRREKEALARRIQGVPGHAPPPHGSPVRTHSEMSENTKERFCDQIKMFH